MINDTRNFIKQRSEIEQKFAELENNYRKSLLENKEDFNQEFIDFFYWETTLKSSYLSDIVPANSGNSYMQIHATKKITRSFICPNCGEDSKYTMQSKNTKQPSICRKCEENKWKEQQELSNKKGQIEVEEEKNKVAELKTMPYKQYLQTEHWQKFRKEALEWADYRCQLCNNGNTTLNVHHRTYENRGNESLEDVIVLCKDCHEKFHNITKIEKDKIPIKTKRKSRAKTHSTLNVNNIEAKSIVFTIQKGTIHKALYNNTPIDIAKIKDDETLNFYNAVKNILKTNPAKLKGITSLSYKKFKAM
jgi:5-methylcytosine-specific restriction endonuclease McrA